MTNSVASVDQTESVGHRFWKRFFFSGDDPRPQKIFFSEHLLHTPFSTAIHSILHTLCEKIRGLSAYSRKKHLQPQCVGWYRFSFRKQAKRVGYAKSCCSAGWSDRQRGSWPTGCKMHDCIWFRLHSARKSSESWWAVAVKLQVSRFKTHVSE